MIDRKCLYFARHNNGWTLHVGPDTFNRGTLNISYNRARKTRIRIRLSPAIPF